MRYNLGRLEEEEEDGRRIFASHPSVRPPVGVEPLARSHVSPFLLTLLSQTVWMMDRFKTEQSMYVAVAGLANDMFLGRESDLKKSHVGEPSCTPFRPDLITLLVYSLVFSKYHSLRTSSRVSEITTQIPL